MKRIEIEFGENGEGRLTAPGLGVFDCLGRPGFPYKSEVTVRKSDKFVSKFSGEYQVHMPWAILIHWQRGAYIHEMPARLASNGGPTAGCIHLDRGPAERVWRYVNGTTRILVRKPWS